MKKTIFIIGSNSFSGSHFVNLALNKNYRVIGISRSNEYNSIYLPYKNSKNIKSFKFYKCDLNKNLKKITSLIKKYRPSYIVNFAAQGMVAESWNKPEDWYNTNVISQVKFLKNLLSYKFLRRYLQVTTPEVYGSDRNWKIESNIFSPSTPYAISRACLDTHLQAYFKVYNFPVLFTRTANVFGPGQQLYRIVPKTLIKSLLKNKITLHGGGKSKRSFIYIEDACRANLKVLLKGKIGETYHISTNKIVSIKELVKKISIKTNFSFKNLTKYSLDRKGKDHYYKLDSKKIRKQLNWKDKISLERGIHLTFIWIIKNFKYLKKQYLEYKHKS